MGACEEQEVGDKGETAQELSHGDVGQRTEQNLVVPKSVPHKKTQLHTCHHIFLVTNQLHAQMVDKVQKK